MQHTLERLFHTTAGNRRRCLQPCWDVGGVQPVSCRSSSSSSQLLLVPSLLCKIRKKKLPTDEKCEELLNQTKNSCYSKQLSGCHVRLKWTSSNSNCLICSDSNTGVSQASDCNFIPLQERRSRPFQILIKSLQALADFTLTFGFVVPCDYRELLPATGASEPIYMHPRFHYLKKRERDKKTSLFGWLWFAQWVPQHYN